MTSNTTNKQDRTIAVHPIPINGDVTPLIGMQSPPQAVEYQVARGRSFTVDGMTFEEGDEVSVGRDVTQDEMRDLVRSGAVWHETDPGALARAARFNPTNHTHQNVTTKTFSSARGMILPGAFCSADDFHTPGHPAEVIEESRRLVHVLELGLRPMGVHTHLELICPRREVVAVADTDGAKALEDRATAGQIIPIPEWALAQHRVQEAARAARAAARDAVRSKRTKAAS